MCSHFDVAIIGAGPSGISAALQLHRYNIPFALMEKKDIGGLLNSANLVENYPGFPSGIRGSELAKLMEYQLKKTGINVLFDTVINCRYASDHFEIHTQSSKHNADYLIIATGTKPRKFQDFKLPDGIQSQVHSDILTIPKGTSDKHISIIGAGDAAFDYALNLSQKNTVTLINRGLGIRCLPILRERVFSSGRINYHSGMNLTDIISEGKKLNLICRCAGNKRVLPTDHLIFAIGREPVSDFIDPSIRDRRIKLEQPGCLQFTGDVNNDRYRQTGIAVGDGIRAAMTVAFRIQGSRSWKS